MTTYAKEIDESYATQMSALAENFSLCCAAAALFYLDPESKKDGLRVEATSIMREFITNVKFGRGDIDSHKPPRVLMLTSVRS